MNADKTKVVKYDPQGFIRAAAQFAPWLLTVNDELVQKFFTAMAVEQTDGSLLLPESIRSFFAVEVVFEDAKPVPPFDSPVSESVFEPVDEAETLRHDPVWDKAFSGNSLMFSDDVGEYEVAAGAGSDSGEFMLDDVPS